MNAVRYSRRSFASRLSFLRPVIAATGIIVPLWRCVTECWYPSQFVNPEHIMDDPLRLNIVKKIMYQLGLTIQEIDKITIAVGHPTQCLGGKSSSGAVIQLTPNLAYSLPMRNFDHVNPSSDQALGLRVSMLGEKHSVGLVPVMNEYPFTKEREGIIAHEIAHYVLNHSKGNSYLHGLLGLSAGLFFFKPTWSLIPMSLFVVATNRWRRYCELSADTLACKTMGLEVTRAMIDRNRAALRLQGMILEKYGVVHTASFSVLSERLFNFLFHVPLPTRISHLQKLEKELIATRKSRVTERAIIDSKIE